MEGGMKSENGGGVLQSHKMATAETSGWREQMEMHERNGHSMRGAVVERKMKEQK